MSEKFELIETPSHNVITSIGTIKADWSNANLIRHQDPYDNYLEYNDGETLHKLNVLDDDWQKLVELNFPWEYWPDMSQFGDGDFIKVNYGSNQYEFRPRNTKLRLFSEERWNHVEHTIIEGKTKGLTVVPALWRMMFKGDYPIKYLPFLDRASREWLESTGNL